jgi:hypothetical protein
MAKKKKNNFIGRFLCNLNLHIYSSSIYHSSLTHYGCKRCGKTKKRINIVEVEVCYNKDGIKSGIINYWKNQTTGDRVSSVTYHNLIK